MVDVSTIFFYTARKKYITTLYIHTENIIIYK